MKLDRLTSAQAPAGGDRNDSDASRADDRPPLRAVGRETVLLGRVWSGYGVAGKQLRSFSPELEALTGEVLFEGSLNVLLPEPVQFENSRALVFDEGRRLLWKGRVSGIDVWVYRWRCAPLHVIELVSATRLRKALQLNDGDAIAVELSRENLRQIPPVAMIGWKLFWLGRREWYYRHRSYSWKAEYWCKLFGANQVAEGIGTLLLKKMKRQNMLARTRNLLSVLGRGAKPYRFERVPIDDGASPEQRAQSRLHNILNYTKTSGTSYSAQLYPAGYHTVEVNGEVLRGQRDPAARLQSVPLDFAGKSVLDIGCNQGGMLFQLERQIKWGIGIDYDYRMVNAANFLNTLRKSDRLHFYVFDLEKEPLDLIRDFLPESKVDIVFLLSVCMWLKNWREVVQFASRISQSMLFETNGTAEQQESQREQLIACYHTVTQISAASEDDPRQRNRRLYLCELPKSDGIQHTA